MKTILLAFVVMSHLVVLAQATDDIQIIDSWIVGENNQGIYYTQTPGSELDNNYFIGAEIRNSGTTTQSNVKQPSVMVATP